MVRRFPVGVAVLAALTVIGATKAGAATEVQPADETVLLVFRSKQGGEAYFQLFPDRGFARLYVRRGAFEPRQGHSAAVVVATEIPKGPLNGPFSVQFGALGTINGEFVAGGPPKLVGHGSRCTGPRSEEERGSFVGRVELRGLHGFVDLHPPRAFAVVQRSAEVRCETGQTALAGVPEYRPDELFGYVYYAHGFFGSTEVLFQAPAQDRKLETDFSLAGYGDGGTQFTAVDYGELAPGLEAALVVEAGTSNPAVLRLRGPEERPTSIIMEPPFPFSGRGTYVPRTGSFRGDLNASFPGIDHRVPLSRPSAKPFACILTPKMRERVCR